MLGRTSNQPGWLEQCNLLVLSTLMMGSPSDAQLRTDKQVKQSHQCTICLEFGSQIMASADAKS